MILYFIFIQHHWKGIVTLTPILDFDIRDSFKMLNIGSHNGHLVEYSRSAYHQIKIIESSSLFFHTAFNSPNSFKLE